MLPLMIAVAYLALISLVAVAVTCYDKWAAKARPQKRTRESTLLLLSAAGGSVAMLIAMLLVRHKTRHLKFMIGIPVIILVQAALIYIGFRYLGLGMLI